MTNNTCMCGKNKSINNFLWDNCCKLFSGLKTTKYNFIFFYKIGKEYYVLECHKDKAYFTDNFSNEIFNLDIKSSSLSFDSVLKIFEDFEKNECFT